MSLVLYNLSEFDNLGYTGYIKMLFVSIIALLIFQLLNSLSSMVDRKVRTLQEQVDQVKKTLVEEHRNEIMLLKQSISDIKSQMNTLTQFQNESQEQVYKFNQWGHDLINDLKQFEKESHEQIDEVKKTLVEHRNEFMLSIANEMNEMKNQKADEMDKMKSQMNTLTQFQKESQIFFEIFKYQNFIGKEYKRENHISGKIMVKMSDLYIINCIGGSFNIDQYLFAEGYGENNTWNSWATHATEEDLLDFLVFIFKNRWSVNFTFPIVKVWVHPVANHPNNNYRYQMKIFRENTESWFNSFPSNIGNLPEKRKTFAEAYFVRVENVLTKLYDMKLYT